MQHLMAAMAALNGHATGGDHDSRYFRRTEKVGDADTVDGKHAADLANASHEHDERYLRQVFTDSRRFEARQNVVVTTLSERPDLVAVSYNLYNSSNQVEASTFVRGLRSPDLRYWVTKVDSGGGDKTYEVRVFNNNSVPLYVQTSIYGRDL